MERHQGMSTTPDPTGPALVGEDEIPVWLEALSRAPWALFFPTCSSHWLSGVRTPRGTPRRTPRRSPEVKP